MKLNGCLREVSKVFQVSMIFSGHFKGGSRKIVGIKVSKRSSKGVSRRFPRCFKEVSRGFKESIKCVSRKFHKKFQGCFKFCFAILLQHESHCSYLSRRRACFFTSIIILLWFGKLEELKNQ